MGRLGFLAVLAVLVLHCSAKEPLEASWSFFADSRAYNLAASDFGSGWYTFGTYIGQIFPNEQKIVVQFADMKIAYMSGWIEVPALRHFKEVPEDAQVIYKPIIVDYSNMDNITILHDPEDPVWSLNMKRSFISVFMLQSDQGEGDFKQQTLFGKCKTKNVLRNKDQMTIIDKVIRHNTCKENLGFDYGIRPWDPTRNNHTPVNITTTYSYRYSGSNINFDDLTRIDTSSILQYQPTPGVRSIQAVEQIRRFYNVSKTTTFERIDTSGLTQRANLTFDYSKGFKGGRDDTTPKKSSAELINEYNERFEEFKDRFNAVPLKNLQKKENFTVYPMYNSLYDMNKQTLEQLGVDIFSKEDNLYQHLFLSFLPYLGTNASLEFIRNLIESEDENLNDLLAIKVLSTFPTYLDYMEDEVVFGLRPLMNLNVSNSQVKYAGILSFASVVKLAGSTETKQEYFNLYYKHFVESEDYEDKMTYLLGLINMGEETHLDTIFQICINPEISHHLRVLAIVGFKPIIKTEGTAVYKHFWPVLQNQAEHYEVRATALDLLLYSDISYEEFQTIINWYHDNFENPDQQHLANYLYTTIQALENSTGYYEYLGDLATEAIQRMKPIRNEHVWTSGNYRMAFTDEDSNFGGSFQARLIANPNTNIINIGILSLDSFAVSMNLGSYTAYIKTQGLPDIGFIFAYLNSRDMDSPVTELLALIQKHGYKIKEFEGAHIEVVLFCDDRVVFGMHIDKDNIDHYSENPLLLDLLKLIIDYNSLSFPLQDFSVFPSDLGTCSKISHDMAEFASYELENIDKLINSITDSSEEVDAIDYNLKYRSLWTYTVFLENYNPIVDGSAETYKFIKEEKLVNIPYSFNLTDYVFKWKHTKDSINYVKDKVIGVSMEEERLAQYCPEYCESDFELPIGDMHEISRRMPPIEALFAMRLNVTVSESNNIQDALDEMEPEKSIAPLEVLSTHKSNSAVQFSKPFLMLWHFNLYTTYLDRDLYSVSIRSEPLWEKPTETVLDLDFDVNDIKNDRDPISGDEVDFSIALTNRNSHDAEVLNYFNVTMVFKDKSVTPDAETQPHIEHNYEFKIYMEEGNGRAIKVCLDREVLYPNRRVDKFSLEPIEPTKVTTKAIFGAVQNISEECPSKQTITFTELYTGTEKNLESLEEYEQCKLQSKGLKFVPPTEDCLRAHKTMSKYDACNVYVDFSKLTGFPQLPSNSEFGFRLLDYRRINNTHVNVSLSQDFLNLFYEDIPDSVLEETSQVNPIDQDTIMSLSPSVVAYGDHDLQIGASSACYISPNQIRTFHGKILNDYNTNIGPEAVAFVECLNETQSGLTVHRVDDKTVGFHFRSENYTLATSQNGKDILWNGQVIKETDTNNEDFKIYFLDQDVIYITNGLVDIQYTTEYIALKAPSIYNNYICGLCAGDKK